METIQIILTATSPELRNMIIESVINLSSVANKTSNPVDVMVVDKLKTLLAIKD
ncbi:MAG: hypothetical protein GH151_01910 [Bacteroidetes bacterium]|nr:hypothetical protein [Bacteroidota bacterium]